MRFYFLRRFTAPQHTQSFCRLFHPTKSFACTAWAVFFFSGEDCTLKISWADRTWYRLSSQRRCKTGAGTSFGANGDPLTWAGPPLLIFCVLTIRKQLPRNGFERSGRGQESSRGHKFSILENFLPLGTASCWGVPAPNPAGTSTANWNLYPVLVSIYSHINQMKYK